MQTRYETPTELLSVLETALIESCVYVLDRATRSALVKGDVAQVVTDWERYEQASLENAYPSGGDVNIWISKKLEVQRARISLRQSCAALATRFGHSRCYSLREQFLSDQRQVVGHQFNWFFD